MRKHPSSILHPQALRLPQRARDCLEALANELRVVRDDVTAAEAARGLCLLALEIVDGAAGGGAAEAFRTAAASNVLSRAIAAFVLLLEPEPLATPRHSGTGGTPPASIQPRAPKHSGRTLHTQAVRLPQAARQCLEGLVRDLRLTDDAATAASSLRGLCLLALDLAMGVAGPGVAEAFRIAASDPTPEGVRRAVAVVRRLVDTEPSTTPNPPANDGPPPTLPSGGAPPPPPPFPHAA